MSQPRTVFGPLLAAAFLVALGGTVALRASSAARDFHPSLNLAEPPLGALPPLIGSPSPRLARRVVLVVIDGLRLRDSYGHPFLDGLRRRGIDAAARSHFPTWSRPNHVTLVTGVPPLWSGVRNNDYRWPVGIDSLMDRAHAAGLSSAYVADVAAGMGTMFHEDFAAMYYAPWPGGWQKATTRLLGEDDALLVLIPGAVDEAGHRSGGDSEDYRDAASEVDRELGSVLGGLDLDRDAIIVTADHGHTDRGGHGGREPEVVEVPLVMAGAGIRAGAALAEVHLVDVAPTVAALLGLPPPGHSLGRVLDEALLVPPEGRAALRRADFARILALTSALELVRNDAAAELHHDRIGRAVLVAGLFALAVGLLGFGLRRGVLQVDWRVLLIAVPAFPVTYYVLLDVFGQSFSLSAIPDRGNTLDRLFDFGLASTAVHVSCAWYAMHGRRVLGERLAAANALAGFGLLTAWLPAAVLWVLYSPHDAILLPAAGALVLVPATYIAVAYFALAAAVTLGLEIVIFFARGLDPRTRLRRLERAAERERRRLSVPPPTA